MDWFEQLSVGGIETIEQLEDLPEGYRLHWYGTKIATVFIAVAWHSEHWEYVGKKHPAVPCISWGPHVGDEFGWFVPLTAVAKTATHYIHIYDMTLEEALENADWNRMESYFNAHPSAK